MGSEEYKKSGVDTDAGMAFVESIKPIVKKATRPEVLGGIGGFGGLFHMSLSKWKEPVLVSGADGVGTKLAIAKATNTFDTIGIDLVAMCVNDIVVCGAEPLFFLDYLAVDSLTNVQAVDIVKGISEGCQMAGCALVGGETAEMPGLYRKGDFDLAGFAVGAVEQDGIIDHVGVRPGDAIIGLASSGFHSNGYSLVRRVVEEHNLDYNQHYDELGTTLGKATLEPTLIYAKLVLNLLKHYEIHSMAHITGGGFYENLPRSLPDNVQARIQAEKWPQVPVIEMISQLAEIDRDEQFSVFNGGIGFVLIVAEKDADAVVQHCNGSNMDAYRIGEVQKQKTGAPKVIVE